jgi:hypothetical protein
VSPKGWSEAESLDRIEASRRIDHVMAVTALPVRRLVVVD